MFNFLHSKKGFTLTELMTVILIIGVLSVIALPIFGAMISVNKKNVCERSQNVVYSAFRQYTEKVEMLYVAKLKINKQNDNDPDDDYAEEYKEKCPDGYLYVKGGYAFYRFEKAENHLGDANYITGYAEFPILETGTIIITKDKKEENGYKVDPGKTKLDIGVFKNLFDSELCCSNEKNHLEIKVSKEKGLFDGYVVEVKCVGSDGVQTNHICSRESAVM